MKNLGLRNNWAKNPPEYTACRAAEHELKTQSPYRGLTVYTCQTCGIIWEEDSSD